MKHCVVLSLFSGKPQPLMSFVNILGEAIQSVIMCITEKELAEGLPLLRSDT